MTKTVKTWVLPPIDLLARFYLGGIFIYAAWGKILDPYAFAMSIATYQILPTSLVNLTAITLPWVEIVAGVLLIVGMQTRAQALLINGMLVVFIAAIYSAVHRGLDLGTCGCFASEEAAEEISMATVWRDVGWLAIGVFIMAVPHRWGVDAWWRHRQEKKWRDAADKEE